MSRKCGIITCICFTCFICFPLAFGQSSVYWLEDGSEAIMNSQLGRTLNMFCYKAKSNKSVLQFWQTVLLHLDIEDDNFDQHVGNSPEEVKTDYKNKKAAWSTSIFGSKQKIRSLKLDLFNVTCMGIATSQKYVVRLQVIHIDYRKLFMTLLGTIMIILSRALSENAIFFYICGVSVGISASLLVFVYLISKLFPRKPLMYGVLAGGWAVGLYLLQMIYEQLNFYKTYLGWYCIVTGFISFVICYKVGPPSDVRSKNLVMWTIQVLGSICLYFSSEYKEPAVGLAVLCLLFKYFPQRWKNFIIQYWHIKFPYPRKLLTDEEYFAEGAIETKKALHELREHCSSPDCAQWRTMLKLKEPKRFASFVEGDSHLSDEEILDFEQYAFSMENSTHKKNSSRFKNNSKQVNGKSSNKLSSPHIAKVSNYSGNEIMSSDDSYSSSSSAEDN